MHSDTSTPLSCKNEDVVTELMARPSILELLTFDGRQCFFFQVAVCLCVFIYFAVTEEMLK